MPQISRLSFFLTDKIAHELCVTRKLATLLSEHIKSELLAHDDYNHAAFDAVNTLNTAYNGRLIEREIGYNPDDLDVFKQKLAFITHSWQNTGGDPVQRPVVYTLAEHINIFHEGSQKKFAESQKIQPAQVTQWLKKDFIVVNRILYSKRRTLNT